MARYRTMTDMATKELLREKLLLGDPAPGTRLVPSELEEEFNLGRHGHPRGAQGTDRFRAGHPTT